MNVYRHGHHIPNSPFKIYVGETEIGNAGRVKVYGKGLSHGMANELNEFFVNTKDAGELFKKVLLYFCRISSISAIFCLILLLFFNESGTILLLE